MEYFAPEKLRLLGSSCLTAAGVSKKNALLVADALTTTSLRGIDSHGVRLFSHYTKAILLGRVNPKPSFRFKKTMPAIGVLDADNGLGIAAGFTAMDHAISMAKKVGMGSVAVSHSSHFGAAGLYTIKAANMGMVGFACTHVEALVLPYNGRKPFFGTNAISIAVPVAGEDPICLDMATTTMTLNKLNMYKAAEATIPKGWAADVNGKITTDSQKAQYLTHFGGYKGYGFAFMVDVFSSMFTGMPWGPHIMPMFPLNDKKRNLGHYFWAINIEGFTHLSTFKKRMSTMVDELRATPSVSNQPVMVPGDPEKQQFVKRSKEGKIPIPKADLDSLITVSRELGINPKKYLDV